MADVSVVPGTLARMLANTGGCSIELVDVDDRVRASVAADAARRAVGGIRHPDENDEPLAAFVSDVALTARGASFSFDIHDAEAHNDLVESVLIAIVDAVR